jgi:hypothetical protein
MKLASPSRRIRKNWAKWSALPPDQVVQGAGKILQRTQIKEKPSELLKTLIKTDLQLFLFITLRQSVDGHPRQGEVLTQAVMKVPGNLFPFVFMNLGGSFLKLRCKSPLLPGDGQLPAPACVEYQQKGHKEVTLREESTLSSSVILSSATSISMMLFRE